jgi:hypothetical protein
VEAAVDKPGGIFNPTNCAAMSITGTIGSSEGAREAVSTPFEAADCATLPFKPGFNVATHAGHTRRNGAYLHVTVTSGSGQANIKSVHVELPKILPSRLETLKQACTAGQFAENPGGCPAGSFVGTAIARTPVLSKPLTGPAIFVSHGNAAFPDLDIVLQGSGITVILEGNTSIDTKTNVTSSDFKSVPDVPVSQFELTLPAGAHSALDATGNLCTQTVTKRVKVKVHGKAVYRKRKVTQKRTLSMPTTITSQSGAVIDQKTKVAVEGCKKAATNTKSSGGRRSKIGAGT